MRKCFLHIGRHKTGSTAIQWALQHYREELERRGYLYPKAGITPNTEAHHNIAGELARFSYFEPRFGTIDELIAEVNACPHHVVISSENFTTAIRSFSEFRAFIRRLNDCGLAVVIVCYVRSPHAYLRSAFLQILKIEFPFGFSHFIAAMLDDEELTWKDHFAGGRDPLVENLIHLLQSGDAGVIVRSYDDVSKTVVADFFSIMGLTFADFSGKDEPRRNEANTTEQALALFFRNVMGRDPDHREHALITAIGAVAPMRTFHISEPAWRLITKKYQPELQVLASRFGVQLANPASNPRHMAGHAGLEELFSETMVRSIQAAARLLAEAADDQDRAYRDVVAHYVAAIEHRDVLAAERDVLAQMRDEAAAERDRAYREVVAHYVAAIEHRDVLAAERDVLAQMRDEAAAERDRAYREVVAHYVAAIDDRDAMAAERDRLSAVQTEVSLALDTVLRSRSWRVTAPLRRMAARFRKRGR